MKELFPLGKEKKNGASWANPEFTVLCLFLNPSSFLVLYFGPKLQQTSTALTSSLRLVYQYIYGIPLICLSLILLLILS